MVGPLVPHTLVPMSFLPLDICPGRVPLRGGGRHIRAQRAETETTNVREQLEQARTEHEDLLATIGELRASSLGLCAGNRTVGPLLGLGSRQDRCLGAAERVVTFLLGLLQLGATGHGVATKLLKLALCLLLRSFGGRPRLIEIGGHLIELSSQLLTRPLPFR